MQAPKIALFLLLSFCAAFADDKLERTGPFTDGSASSAVRESLEPVGHKFSLGTGKELAEIWLRKSVAIGPKKNVEGSSYPELAVSEFIGVISFPDGAKDFRGNPVKPGTYTLRYGLMPNDGNHLGAAPSRDFLLVTPIAQDTNPAATFTTEELIAMSKKSMSVNHPGVFMLLPTQGGEAARAYQNADSFDVFAGKLKGEGGKELPFELVLKGSAQQ